MTEIILAIIIVIFLLLILAVLFLFTVKRVDVLVKKIFIDKLQEYDFLIEEKEKKVEELNLELETKRSEKEDLDLKIEKLISKKDQFAVENNDVVIPTGADFQDDKMFEKYKKIKEGFNFNYEQKVIDFLNSGKVNDDGKHYLYKDIRKVLTHKAIYKISTYNSEEQKTILNNLFHDDVKLIIKDLLEDKHFNIVNFVSKIDALISDTDPKIYIYVGDQRFNFNKLNPNIETIYDTKITEGFRIEYKGKIYDYSI